MKKLLVFAWITLLSIISRSADASISADDLTSNAFSTQSSEQPITSGPVVFSGGGTATCGSAGPQAQTISDDLWQKQVNEMMFNARTETEKQMVIDMVLSITNADNQ